MVFTVLAVIGALVTLAASVAGLLISAEADVQNKAEAMASGADLKPR